MDNKSLKLKLISLFLSNPVEGRRIARQYGLWNWFQETCAKPIHMKLCRANVNFFIEYVIKDPDTHKNVKQQWFHKEWQKLISENKYTLIGAPRGHAKSVALIARVIWEIGNNHDIRVKFVGSADEKAREILGLVANLVKESEEVRNVFPDLIIDTDKGDRKEAFFVKRKIAQRDPTCQASGVFSTGAGGRADLLVFDDVVDPKNAIVNPAMREQVISVVTTTWLPLLSSVGKAVWIATPYHMMDCTHHFKNSPSNSWKVWWIPAIRQEEAYDKFGDKIFESILDKQGNIVKDLITGEIKVKPVMSKICLWPDKWNLELLEQIKGLIGDRAFAQQYLLNAMSDSDRTFSEEDLSKSYDETRANIGDDIPDSWPTFGGVDLASALGKKAAWTVIWTLAMNPDTKRLYLKKLWRKKCSFTATVEAIVSEYEKQQWKTLYVENNGYQGAVVEAIENLEDINIPVQGFTTTATGKFDEKVGLPGLSLAFSRGKFAIPSARFDHSGNLPSDENSDFAIFMTELKSHPGGNFSDTVMALWFAYRAAVDGNSDFVKAYAEAIRG